MIYAFGNCELDTQLYVLYRANRHIRLRPKVFQVLSYLLEHRDRVIAKDELCSQLWPNQAVSDAALESTIKAVRHAVGDSGRAQWVIQTSHGHGYRFVAAVEVHPELHADRQAADQSPPSVADATPARDRVEAVPAAAPLSEAFPQAPLVPHMSMAERKLVTVLCCTLVRPREPSARLDLDILYSQMQTLYDLAQRIVLRYEGALQPIAGDRLLVLFGVPVTYEDHAQRAALAALGLQQRIAEHRGASGGGAGKTLEVRISLHTGLVAIGGIGDQQAAFTAVIGDATLLAVALQEHAAPGTILCSDTTARLVQGAIRLESGPPVALAGPPPPLPVYRVVGVCPQRTPVGARGDSPMNRFVGRARELATLHALLEQVEEGRGHVVGIMGEPGIGKSRLIQEFRRSLTGVPRTYLAAHCVSYGRTLPYFPVLGLLRHNCGLTPMDTAEAIAAKVRRSLEEVGLAADERMPYLLHLLGLPVTSDWLVRFSPSEIKTGMLDTLVQLCLNGSRRRPLIIEVEDLHWIDAASEEWLALLTERLGSVPLLLVTTYRPGYRPPWLDKSYVTQQALGRLAHEESRRVVQSVAGTTPLAEPVVQEIVAKADGNPFFLEELARTVQEQGVSPQHLLAVPDTIQAVLAARLDRLPLAAKHLLQVAATIGSDISRPLLRAVTDLPEAALAEGLRHLQHAEFLYELPAFPELAYTFKHTLLREVVYESLLKRTRQQYHQRIAEVLATQFPETAATQPAVLAHHYTEAGLPDQALVYWQRAGDHANERSAFVEASAHFTKGLDVLLTLPDTPARTSQELRLHLALGAALIITKGYTAPEVVQVYTRMQALSQQEDDLPLLERFQTVWGLWHFYAMQAEYQTARALAEQLLSLAQQFRDPDRLMDAHMAQGCVAYYRSEFSTARVSFEQALASYNVTKYRPTPVAVLLAEEPGPLCLTVLADVLWYLGYADQARRRMQEAVTLARQFARPINIGLTLIGQCFMHRYLCETQMVQQGAEALSTYAAAHGLVGIAAVGTMLGGWALAMQGQGPEGLVPLQQGLATWRAMGIPTCFPAYLLLLAEVYSKEGQVDAARHVLDEVLEVIEQHSQHTFLAEVLRLKGELLLLSSVPDEAQAETYFTQAYDVAHRRELRWLALRAALSLSRLWQRQGKPAKARHLLSEVYGEITEGFDTPGVRAVKALLEALL